MTNVPPPSVHRRVVGRPPSSVMGGNLAQPRPGLLSRVDRGPPGRLERDGGRLLRCLYAARFPELFGRRRFLERHLHPLSCQKYAAVRTAQDQAWWVFSTVMTFLHGLLLIGFVCVGEIFAPQPRPS